MAQLWQRKASEQAREPGEWTPRELGLEETGRTDSASLLKNRAARPDAEVWVLVGSASVRVNGEVVLCGIRVLEHRDEIRVGDAPPLYFSMERLANVEPLPQLDRKIFCARCKLEITLDSPAVRCPACSIWHHQSEKYPCWTYAPSCALCSQETALDTGYRWTPEEI